jgi:two-component system, chemotaxis family, protein-glutamate methylesterase/glutaminase
MSATAVRVAICEDSPAYAAGLRRFLETDGELRVVAVTPDAESLIAALPGLRPDLVTMGLELSGISGIEAIRRIMATRPVPIVVISRHLRFGGGMVDRALDAGAVAAVAKAGVRFDERDGRSARALRDRLSAIAGAGTPDPEARPAPAPVPAPPAPPLLPRRGVASVVGIGASAGGPPALATILGALSADFALPVLVVQHISPGFAAGLATWLDGIVALPVRLARDGDAAGPGIAIAPDGAHLVLADDGRHLRLDRRTGGSHRPGADMLLCSLAQRCGRGAVAVVLSGMGRDGAAGVAAIRAAHGAAVAERPEDARLSGMPSAAAQAGAAPLALAEIGRLLATLSGGRPS